MFRFRSLLAFFVILLSLGCRESESSHLSEVVRTPRAIWSEYLPLETVATYLPQLKAEGIDLYLAMPPRVVAKPELYDFLRLAKSEGVRVHAWMLMSAEDGFWANKWNAQNLVRDVRNLLTALDREGLGVEWITIDMEPKMETMLALKKHIAAYDIKGLTHLAQDLASSASLKTAQNIFRDLVTELHERNIKTHVVTLPFVIDDLVTGRDGYQNVLGLPIQGVPWDRVSFMLYRPFFAEMIGKVSPRLIYSYAQDARKFFKGDVAVDLGPLGADGSDPLGAGTYRLPAEMHEDMAAVRAAGIDRMQIFSLDGMHRVGQFSEWLAVPPARKPSIDLKAASLRKSFQAMGGFLPSGQ